MFCDEQPETVVHLFWHCTHTKMFCLNLSKFIIENIYTDFVLLWKEVLFGLFSFDVSNKDTFYVINFVLLLAKFHIHKCKFSDKKPCFLVLKKEIDQYFKTIQYSTIKKHLN